MKSYDHYWTSTLLWKKSLLISRNADNSNVNGQHRDSQLTREQYVLQCNAVNNLIKSLKSQHYSSIIKENSGNKKKSCSELFRSTFRKRPYASWRICCPFLLLRRIHYIMISLLKRMLSLIRPNVLLMRYSLCLRLNFQLLLRSNLMTSGNWLQHCSRSPVSWIHYHLHYQTMYRPIAAYHYFVKAACLRVWNLQ